MVRRLAPSVDCIRCSLSPDGLSMNPQSGSLSVYGSLRLRRMRCCMPLLVTKHTPLSCGVAIVDNRATEHQTLNERSVLYPRPPESRHKKNGRNRFFTYQSADTNATSDSWPRRRPLSKRSVAVLHEADFCSCKVCISAIHGGHIPKPCRHKKTGRSRFFISGKQCFLGVASDGQPRRKFLRKHNVDVLPEHFEETSNKGWPSAADQNYIRSQTVAIP